MGHIILNGQNHMNQAWESGCQNLASISYTSRQCIGLSGGAAGYGVMSYKMFNDWGQQVGLSTDSRLMPMVLRTSVAFKSVGGSGSIPNLYFIRVLNCGYNGDSPIYTDIGLSGGKMIVTCQPPYSGVTKVYNTHTFSPTIATATFYTVEVHQYRDKCRAWLNGVDSGWFTNGSGTLTPAATTPFQLQVMLSSSGCDPCFDTIFSGVWPVDYSTGGGAVTINGADATGRVYLIKKSYLQSGKASGDVYDLALAAGAYTESATNNMDYLMVAVDSNNTGGGAVKKNKSSGDVWTASNWSLT